MALQPAVVVVVVVFTIYPVLECDLCSRQWYMASARDLQHLQDGRLYLLDVDKQRRDPDLVR